MNPDEIASGSLPQAIVESLPDGSNWVAILTFAMMVAYLTLREVVPFLRKKTAAPAEVRTELALEDRESLQTILRELRHLRERLDELLIMAKVDAELRTKQPRR